MSLLSWLVSLLLLLSPSSNEVIAPVQPDAGPGGKDYQFAEVLQTDFAQAPDGYWLYEPATPKPDSAHVVVFIHGYGAYNPMIYGNWIRHLVQKGNIVIFPRYQRNLLSPKPSVFATNVATAIKDALQELEEKAHVKPITEQLSIIGHSYGGVVSGYLGVHYEDLGIPQPKAIMMVSPGSGPFRGGRLDSYEGLDEDLKLLIMVSDNDHIVGDSFGELVFASAKQVKQRNFIRQYADDHGKPKVSAGHNESYSLYTNFDSGLHNITAKRAKRKSKLDAVDYYGYWKLFDGLLNCTRSGSDCEFAFGNTPEQISLGNWSDGQAVRPLEVILPEE
ncbi:MAG: hypothetical protein AB8G15_14745 [Saprospiraceae bacterium]